MSLETRLAELLDQFAPVIRDAFLAAIRDITDDVILRQLVEAIERGDVEGAFRSLGITPPVFNPVLNSLTATMEAVGATVTATFPQYLTRPDGTKVKPRFDIRDKAAEEWLRRESSALVTRIEEDIRDGIRGALENGMIQGRNPRNVALDIVGRVDQSTGQRVGGILGLTAQQERWSRSVERALRELDEGYFDYELRDKRFDRTVRAAITSGKPLTIETVEKLMTRYRANALRHRGEMVGRTEALAALNKSEYLSVMQGIKTGDLPMSATVKVWDSAGDGRVRPSHKALDGQTVGMNEPFVSPVTQARMMHPGDASLGATGNDIIMCRCRVRYVTDWAYGVE